jgi:hypothetical protein
VPDALPRPRGPCPGGRGPGPGRPRRGLRTPGPQFTSLAGGANGADLQAYRLAAQRHAAKTSPGSPRLPGYGEQPAPAGWREDQDSRCQR